MRRTLLIIVLGALCLPASLYAGPLARIYICPRDLGLAASAKQQFTVIGEDADGNEVSPGAVVWSATVASGSITPAGLFTAGSNAAKYIPAVTAVAGGFTATASVEVYSGQQRNGYVLERSIGSLNSGSLDSPTEIAFDGTANAYILSQSANAVSKFDSAGKCVAQFKLLNPLTSASMLAVTANGTMYIADPATFCIRKYDPSGSFVTQWGAEGSGNGQFYDLTDIAVDSTGQVFVADAARYCIQVFTSSGAFVRSWTTREHSYSGLYDTSPSAIAVDAAGHIWAWARNINFHYPELQEYDSLGNLLSYSTAWLGCDWHDSPHVGIVPSTFPMAVDSSGCVYQAYGGAVTKFYKRWADEYDVSASWIMSRVDDGTVGIGTGMALGPSGNVYVTDKDNNRVQIFDSGGQFLTSWRSSGSDKGQLRSPSGITVDSQGNLYVSDTGNRRVQEFDSSGGFVRELASQQQKDSAFACPSGLTLDAQGNLDIADCVHPRILVYSSTGTLSSIWPVPSPDGFVPLPMGLARDPISQLLFLADTGRNFMDTFSSTGSYLSSWSNGAGTGDGYVQSPAGIALDSLARQYVSDYGNNRIQRFNGGVFSTKWGTAGAGSGQFQGPAGICIDSGDSIYVADSGNCRVQKFTSSGAYLMQFGSSGFGAFQFTDPEAVAVDAAGNLYVADTGNHRVLKFKKVPTGTISITGPTEAATYSTNRATVDLSGTASGSLLAISWSNSRGGSGACTGLTSWSADGVPLKNGQNVITVTACDTYGGTISDAITVTTTAPSVAISSPTAYQSYLTRSSTISLAGTASDDSSLASVTWSSDRGGSGTCTGLTNWTANNISLQPGRNTLTVTAKDSGRNVSTAVLLVIYSTCAPTTISALRQNPSEADVYLTDQNVTAIFGDCFYIEQSNRASALKIKLPFPSDLMSIGLTVDVAGTLKTGADGERYIDGVAKTKS